MPVIVPESASGFLGGVWRSWVKPYVFDSGSWIEPKYVWAYHHGEWSLVWAKTATKGIDPQATINGVTVDITWDAPGDGLEVLSDYEVRRSDNSLVIRIEPDGGSYLVNDSAPLSGTHAYTVQSRLNGEVLESVETNTVTLGVVPDSVTATVEDEGRDSNVMVEWDTTPGAASFDVFDIAGNKVGSTVSRGIWDRNPKPGVGSYSVRAVLSGGAQGDARLSNSLTLAQAPSSLTAAAPTNGDDVALSWSVDGCGHHDQIQVVRGGSSLAYLARGATSYTDTNAREGTVESYKVRAVISGNHGPYSNQATSAIPANVPTSVTAAATTTKGQVKLSWGHPAGSHTGYEVQANDGSWVNVSDTTSPSYHTFSGSSGSKSMRVRTLSAGGASAYVTASATPVWLYAPNVPNNVSVAATSTVGQLKLSWSAPTNDSTHDAPTSYQVQTSTNNSSWTNRGNQNSPYTYGFGSSGTGARYMRVRATNGAGSSSYVSKSGTPLWDVTPPALPVITSYKPEASWGRMVLRFTINDADTTAYRVWRDDPDLGPPNWNSGWVTAGKGNHYVVVGAPYDGKPHNFNGAYVQVRDTHGNATDYRSCSADYKLVESPIVHRAKTAGHTRNGMFDSVSSLANQPAQGYHSSGNEYSGLWYYGTNVVYNSMKTSGTHCGPHREATSWNVGIWRENSSHGTASLAPIYLGLHGWGEKPEPFASTGGAVHVVHFCEEVASLGRGGGVYASFSAGIMAGLIDNPAYFQGLGVACNGFNNSYVKLFSHTQDPNETGRLAIWHLG